MKPKIKPLTGRELYKIECAADDIAFPGNAAIAWNRLFKLRRKAFSIFARRLNARFGVKGKK